MRQKEKELRLSIAGINISCCTRGFWVITGFEHKLLFARSKKAALRKAWKTLIGEK